MDFCRFLPWALLVLLLAPGQLGCTTEREPPELEQEEPELARHMMNLQRWTHKTTLAIDARNGELADFYLHEMEETVETIEEEVPSYEGHAIAELTEKMLAPRVETLATHIDDRAWSAVDEQVDALARSCNQCHAATEHGFVQIDLEDVPNPYPQDFSTSP